MSKDRDFFNLLRRKIEIEPSRDFDRKFWEAFEKENPGQRSPLAAMIEWARQALASHRLAFGSFAAAAAIAGIMVLQHQRVSPPVAAPSTEIASVNEMMADQPMLDQLDLLMAFDDVTAITDDDWKVLLAES